MKVNLLNASNRVLNITDFDYLIRFTANLGIQQLIIRSLSNFAKQIMQLQLLKKSSLFQLHEMKRQLDQSFIIFQKQQISMIKFKRTQGNEDPIELAYESNRTVEDYITDLADLYDAQVTDLKLVFKGKILNWKSTAQAAKLQGGTVMVVVNNIKKEQKKVLTSKQQVVPGAGMATGLGSSSPFGIGGYEVVNHPQYMSAISSAVDPDKMEEMLDDPQYQGMLEQMMEDPDTLRQLMEENPMMKNMMNNNPMMKSMLSNPAMLKMIFNKDTIKKTKEYLKNGGTVPDMQQPYQPGAGMLGQAPFAQPFANMTQMPGAYNPNLANQQNQNPNMPMFPFYNPMGSLGFGGQSLFKNPQAQAEVQKLLDEATFKDQLKELQLMGFKDRARNLEILKQVNGNVDSALEKLCSE